MHTDANSKTKESVPHSQMHNRDFYNTSIIKPNSLLDICNDISNAENNTYKR